MPCSVQARLDDHAYMRPKNIFVNIRMIMQYVPDEIGVVVGLNQGMGQVSAYPETGGKGKMGLQPNVDSVKGSDHTGFCRYWSELMVAREMKTCWAMARMMRRSRKPVHTFNEPISKLHRNFPTTPEFAAQVQSLALSTYACKLSLNAFYQYVGG
jgi:hypothetical protein